MARPDLALQPPSGSAMPAGPASVSWTAPSAGAELRVLVGTSPGDADVAGGLALASGEAIDFTFPAEAERVYLSAWLDVPDSPGGPAAYSYAATYSIAEASLAPETIVRRLLSRYWLEAWLGPALDERRFSPAAALGFAGSEVSFSVENAADVAPWTPAEIRAETGYALLRFREVDRFDDGLTAGSEGEPGEEQTFASEYVLYALDFELAAPSKLRGGDPVEVLERRAAEVERLFSGLALYPDSASVLSIRNLARYPTRRRGGTDDGTWRRAFLTVQVRARVRRSHVGAKEVSLP